MMTKPTSEQVTFLAAGSGAVQRTALDKFRDTVSVKDFGATGDGVTDDTAAVQAAVSAASGVFFPAGTYIVRNVTVGSDKSLYGDGGATVKLKQLASLDFSPCFNVTGNNVRFANLIFDGNRSVQPADGFSDSWNTGGNGTGKSNRAAILMDGVPTTTLSGLDVRDCTFTAFYAGSIATRSVNNVSVRNCSFANSNLEGCFLYGFGTTRTQNVSVTGCSFKSLYTGTSVEANGIITTQYDGVIISNNWCDDCGRTLIKLETCNEAIVDSNQVSNNRVPNFNAMQAQGACNRLVFSNNVLKNVGFGILVGGAGSVISGVVIDGNLIDTVTGTTGSPDGIVCEYINGLTISNNSIFNAFRQGILCSGFTGNVIISSNRIIKSTGVASSGPAIQISPAAGDAVKSLVIEGNLCSGHQMGVDGIIALQGNVSNPATFESIMVCDNTLIGVGAPSNRGLRSTTGQVFTTGMVANNVSNADIEFKGGAGTSLVCRNNYGTIVILLDDQTFARALPSTSTAPASGAHRAGDIVLNSSPSGGAHIGWVCTVSGTPGTWKTFGAITV